MCALTKLGCNNGRTQSSQLYVRAPSQFWMCFLTRVLTIQQSGFFCCHGSRYEVTYTHAHTKYTSFVIAVRVPFGEGQLGYWCLAEWESNLHKLRKAAKWSWSWSAQPFCPRSATSKEPEKSKNLNSSQFTTNSIKSAARLQEPAFNLQLWLNAKRCLSYRISLWQTRLKKDRQWTVIQHVLLVAEGSCRDVD